MLPDQMLDHFEISTSDKPSVYKVPQTVHCQCAPIKHMPAGARALTMRQVKAEQGEYTRPGEEMMGKSCAQTRGKALDDIA